MKLAIVALILAVVAVTLYGGAQAVRSLRTSVALRAARTETE